MHPEIVKTLVEQHRQELVRSSPASKREHTGRARSGWLSRLPRWHVSWSRTVLSPAGALVGSGRSDRPGRTGSSLVIIISAHRSA